MRATQRAVCSHRESGTAADDGGTSPGDDGWWPKLAARDSGNRARLSRLAQTAPQEWFTQIEDSNFCASTDNAAGMKWEVKRNATVSGVPSDQHNPKGHVGSTLRPHPSPLPSPRH